MNNLKERWNIKSNWQIVAIFLVFSINGSFATWVAKPLTEFIGISFKTHGWLFWVIRIPLIFVVYQITLPLSGWLFGQFKFFWNMEKKMLKRVGFKRLFPE
ncbi:MAG: diacylglyceryl transferase [Flavobacteriaceae bacterium]|nr:diacylglyceryl transferase [Flavobacteriaceae bacterium]